MQVLQSHSDTFLLLPSKYCNILNIWVSSQLFFQITFESINFSGQIFCDLWIVWRVLLSIMLDLNAIPEMFKKYHLDKKHIKYLEFWKCNKASCCVWICYLTFNDFKNVKLGYMHSVSSYVSELLWSRFCLHISKIIMLCIAWSRTIRAGMLSMSFSDKCYKMNKQK